MSREAMKLALEALEGNCTNPAADPEQAANEDAAITALRQALVDADDTSQERVDEIVKDEHEPVAWANSFDLQNFDMKVRTGPDLNHTVPLYTAPTKREWVGLTDEEIDALSQARSLTDELMDCVDRLGSEADTVDPRVWQHLLVYAPKPEHEPVAWRYKYPDGFWRFSNGERVNGSDPIKSQALYTSPPKADEWVGLTALEVYECWKTGDVVEAVEAKLREKNT